MTDSIRRIGTAVKSRGNVWQICVKVQEEVGELAEAIIGFTGDNPRKGTTHTIEDVMDEALDVAVTALHMYVAACDSADDPHGIEPDPFAALLAHAESRALRAEATP